MVNYDALDSQGALACLPVRSPVLATALETVLNCVFLSVSFEFTIYRFLIYWQAHLGLFRIPLDVRRY